MNFECFKRCYTVFSSHHRFTMAGELQLQRFEKRVLMRERARARAKQVCVKFSHILEFLPLLLIICPSPRQPQNVANCTEPNQKPPFSTQGTSAS